MKGPYRDELAALPTVYADALNFRGSLAKLWAELGTKPAVFIGSGGAVAVAHLAASLFSQGFGQPAQACTALEALSMPFQQGSAALLLSASAKHPDAALVLEAFRRRLFAASAVLTQRKPEDLLAMAGPDCSILQLPPPAVRDGFLATGSLMQMAVAMLDAAGFHELPSRLDIAFDRESPVRTELLVLYPPALRAVAADIEVRLVESGLAAVQVADYRNFAHGRHTGLARRLDQVTVVAISDDDSHPLAEGTLRCLPQSADVRRWHEPQPWPLSVPRLLARSMVLAAELGEAVGLDVARPSVPRFGRDLYHLPLRRRVEFAQSGSIERKLRANQHAGIPVAREQVQEARWQWEEVLRQTRIGGVVMDYDGTVCWTSRRYEIPEPEQREQLLRLLDSGALIGFASGRGQSLYQDLRSWIPQSAWPQVRLGLYNGSITLGLSDELGAVAELRQPTPWSTSVMEVLRTQFRDGEIVERGTQVSMSARTASPAAVAAARAILHEADVPAIVVASGHTVDVIPIGATKSSVVLDIQTRTGDAVLAIGDQGQPDGNDFSLLAQSPSTLTVDRCSPALDRCWFDGDGRTVGPDLLSSYLSKLRKRGQHFRFTPTDVR